MSRPSEPNDSLQHRTMGERFEQACDRFEAAWKADENPRIEDFLADLDRVFTGDYLPAEADAMPGLKPQQGAAPYATGDSAAMEPRGKTFTIAADRRGPSATARPGGAPKSGSPNVLIIVFVLGMLGLLIGIAFIFSVVFS